MDNVNYILKTMDMADLAEKIANQVLEAARGGEDDDNMTWFLATATLATALDAVSMKCGRNPAETRNAVLAVAPEVDEIVGDMRCPNEDRE